MKGRPLIAILRGITPQMVVPIAQTLCEHEIFNIEIPLNSPDPFKSLELLAEEFGTQAFCGAGTVTTVEEVKQVKLTGVSYIVSPNCDGEVIQATLAAGMESYPGITTPTEAFSALASGATNLKLFPAGDLGPGYAKSIKAVLPDHARLIAVGNISGEDLQPFFDTGVSGFGIGGAIYSRGDSPGQVAKKAAVLVHAYDRIC